MGSNKGMLCNSRNKIRQRRPEIEQLEARWTPAWASIPPATMPALISTSGVTLNSGSDAAGSGAITSGEVDYYAFTARTTGTYRLSANSSQFDTVLGLFNASGTRLAYNNDVVTGINTNSQRLVTLLAGTKYYLGVSSNGSQGGSYSWTIDGGTLSSTTTTTTTTPSLRPDLQGAVLAATNSSPWGAAINVQYAVRNAGSDSAGSSQVQFWLSRNTTWSSDDIILTDLAGVPTRTISSLSAGATSATGSVTVALPPAGYVNWSGSTFYIVMRVDTAGQVAESNEFNNSGQLGSGRDYDPITIGTTSTTTTSGTSTGGFQITFNTSGLTTAQRDIFLRAADRWEEVIAGDLPNATYAGRVVDDLLIDARVSSIDGVGGILGQSGPDAYRSGSYLPIHAAMEFDSADIADMQAKGTLEGVIEHEIGHALGIGTIWERRGLLLGAGTSNPTFIGPRATAEYNRIYGTSAAGVPVENGGGTGTRDAHWRETSLETELMTGYVDKDMALSRITVASLADLGYAVNMDAADAFQRPLSSSSTYAVASTTSSLPSLRELDALFAAFDEDGSSDHNRQCSPAEPLA